MEVAYYTNNANCIALSKYSMKRGVVAVEHLHTIVHIGFGVVRLDVNRVIAVVNNKAFNGNLLSAVFLGVGAQFLKSYACSLAVGEIRVDILREYVKLLCCCLCDSLYCDIAIACFAGLGTNCETFLKKLDVKVAVFRALSGLVPDPNKVSTVTVEVPAFCVTFDDDGVRFVVNKLFLCESGSSLAPFLDLTGRLGSVNCKISCLDVAVGVEGTVNIEVGCVSVDVHLNGNLLLSGGGRHIKLYLTYVINVLVLRLLICLSTVRGGFIGVCIITSREATYYDTQKEKQ